MKMKLKIAVFGAFVAMALTSYSAGKIVANNGGDDGSGINITIPATRNSRTPKDLQPPHSQMGQNFVVITSLCATNSPGSSASLVNSRGYVGGGDVVTNRLIDPSACYPIPVGTSNSIFGLQWFDNITTMFPSYLGSVGGTNAGSRIVALLGGQGSPGEYSWRVSSSDSRIGSVSGTVSTNSATGIQRIFNPQFIGISYGPNGTNTSYWEPTQKIFVQGSGNTVYDGRQSTNVHPSDVSVDSFYSFGPAIQILIGTPADYIPIRNDYATTNQWLTIELVRNGSNVVSRTVYSAGASGQLVRDTPLLERLSIIGGQMNMPYDVFSSTNPMGPWVKISGATIIPGSQGEMSITNRLDMEFFRFGTRLVTFPVVQ